MSKFPPAGLVLVVIFCVLSSVALIPQYQYSRSSNRTIAEDTWHFFRNRNRQQTPGSHFDNALLLDSQTSLPSNALHAPRKMLILLGARFFNPDLQSISIPREAYLYPNGQLDFSNRTKVPARVIKKRILALRKYSIGEFKQKSMATLSAYSSCPIMYIWKDYGEQYWPRWVKEGQCVDLEETSCSLPPGMFCVGHEERTVVMLRYFCPLSGDENSCNWYRMQKPVLVSCKCAD